MLLGGPAVLAKPLPPTTDGSIAQAAGSGGGGGGGGAKQPGLQDSRRCQPIFLVTVCWKAELAWLQAGQRRRRREGGGARGQRLDLLVLLRVCIARWLHGTAPRGVAEARREIMNEAEHSQQPTKLQAAHVDRTHRTC